MFYNTNLKQFLCNYSEQICSEKRFVHWLQRQQEQKEIKENKMYSLVYVDAENVSINEVKTRMAEIHSQVKKKGSTMIGKFYGNRDVIYPMFSACYQAGLDFVETSTLSHNRKNLADIKMIVDCISDVYSRGVDSIDTVYLLTGDNDFIPLVYKLMSFGIEVDTSLTEPVQEVTADNVGKELRALGFNPYRRDDVFCNLCPEIHKLIADNFSERLATEYLISRLRKLITALQKRFPDKNFKVLEQQYNSISLDVILELVGASDLSTIQEVAHLYTKKLFGITLKQPIILQRLAIGSTIYQQCVTLNRV